MEMVEFSNDDMFSFDSSYSSSIMLLVGPVESSSIPTFMLTFFDVVKICSSGSAMLTRTCFCFSLISSVLFSTILSISSDWQIDLNWTRVS